MSPSPWCARLGRIERETSVRAVLARRTKGARVSEVSTDIGTKLLFENGRIRGTQAHRQILVELLGPSASVEAQAPESNAEPVVPRG